MTVKIANGKESSPGGLSSKIVPISAVANSATIKIERAIAGIRKGMTTAK
jgi:hypothetical protein